MSVFQPNASATQLASKSITLNVNNTTGSIATFTVTGQVLIMGFWMVPTTVFSANVTAAHLRLNDQTATIDISLAAGVALSAAPVGSFIGRTGLAAAALTLKSNATGAFLDGNAAGLTIFTPFMVEKKSGAATTIDFRYTTTDAPSSGAATVYAMWIPLTSDGALT